MRSWLSFWRARPPRGAIRVSIGFVLVFGFSGLVVLAVSLVLWIAIWSGQQNTIELARDRAELTIALVEDGIRHRLDPVMTAGAGLADLVANENIDPFTERRWIELAGGMLVALPQISAIRYVAADGRVFRLARSSRGGFRHRTYVDDSPDAARVAGVVSRAERAFWGDVFWGEAVGEPAVNLRAPVRRNGEYIGHVSALVSIANLSRLLLDLAEQHRAHSFILLEGYTVLAHPSLLFGFEDRGRERPLPSLGEIGDPILARIWDQGNWVDRTRSRRVLGERGHLARFENETYLYVYHEVDEFGPRLWTIGTYLREETLEAAFARMWYAAFAGFGILVIAALVARLIGQRVARPVGALAEAARHVRRLELGHVRHLRRSRFREMDDAAQAFNAMIEGLRWFEAYVPRALVRRLIGRGGDMPLLSVEREVTVMFTDIAGFTALSEQMQAGEVAAFLNRHFELLEASVEAQDGTVDKYLGDGMMVFWGAPDEQPDHARRACLAAIAIATAIRTDNHSRREKGEPVVRVRIGIHSGPATVGNVGSAARLNYTIVGDTVNSADRLCEIGRGLLGEAEDLAILVSGRTVAQAGEDFRFQHMGELKLRGRKGEVDVFRLIDGRKS
ncbi:MAG: adenylate/guanylate cyclase domain-containing protein [Alphaproteobacteria bacterium]|nr:adenylate/guanylate cyclase domain-containing protein [Alphaproteobacteria bacterium]